MSSVALSKTGSKRVTNRASGGLKACADVDGLKVKDMADSFILFHLHECKSYDCNLYTDSDSDP